MRNDAVRFVEGDEHRWSFKCRVSSFKKIVIVRVLVIEKQGIEDEDEKEEEDEHSGRRNDWDSDLFDFVSWFLCG